MVELRLGWGFDNMSEIFGLPNKSFVVKLVVNYAYFF